MSYRLSVLDQTPIPPGGTAHDGLSNTIDLARHCDALGYERYWIAEHHASQALAGAAPEAMIGPIALATQRIRVGSGGIMLPHYSPYKVAETFGLLAALAPGRIDLGIGRAPGSDQRTSVALQRDRSRMQPYDFPDALSELSGYIEDTIDPSHPFAPLAKSMPSVGLAPPEVWLLGSSPDSAQLAAERGLPYCFADFINPQGADLARQYRRAFKPGPGRPRPQVIVACSAIAADTQDEADAQAMPTRMLFAHLTTGRFIPVPSIEEASAWVAANGDPGYRRRRLVLGTPAKVRAELDQVATDYQADEVMLVNIMADHAARKRSYALIAAEYGLAEQALAA